MFHHLMTTAWRNFLRTKSSSLIGIVGLAIGLACFIAAWGAVAFLHSSDAHYKNANRIVVITERVRSPDLKFDTGDMVASSPPVAHFLPLEVPELEKVARASWYRNLSVAADERNAFVSTTAVTPEFLEIFDLPWESVLSASPLKAPRSAVISEKTAMQLFGTTAALGKTITVQRSLDVTVSGVFRDLQQPSHMGSSVERPITFDMLITRETREALDREFTGGVARTPPYSEMWAQSTGVTYALLPADGSITAAYLNGRLEGFADRHKPARMRFEIKHRAVPVRDIQLTSLNADLFQGNGLTVISVLMTLASIVLGVACVNSANLATAHSLARSGELGMRRVLGASRRQLFLQQLVECGLHVLAAFGLALLATFLASRAIKTDASISIAPLVVRDIAFWLGIFTAAALMSILLAAYNTHVVVRRLPIDALRATSSRGTKGALSILTGVQFAAAAFLLIGLFVLTAQNASLRNSGLQVNEDPVLVVNGAEETARFEVLSNALLQNDSIKSVSAVTERPWSKYGGISTFDASPNRPSTPGVLTGVRPNFDSVLGMQLLAGRSFDIAQGDRDWPQANGLPPSTPDATADKMYSVMIDRTMARQFGWTDPATAVGAILSQDRAKDSRVQYRIIGVLEDKPFRLESLNGVSGNVYGLMSTRQTNSLVIKIDKDRISEAVAAIDATWKELIRDVPINRRFLDFFFELEFRTFARAQAMLTLVTVVGVIVAALGLFSIAVFVAQRRLREIGVRKTLGARSAQIVRMLVSDFSRPIVVANVLIWPLAYFVVQKYLNVFIQRIELNWMPFAASLAVSLLIAWIAVGGQAWRAARVNPADVLRRE